MGAWGEHPEENDGSHDKFDPVARASAGAVAKLFKKQRADTWERWERVGVVQLMMHQMPGVLHYMQDTLKATQYDLDIIIDDEDFLGSWKSPNATKQAARALRVAIDKILRKM